MATRPLSNGLVLLCLLIGVATAPAADVSSASGTARNQMWDAMKALPDWSGTWATSATAVKGAMSDCCLGRGDQLSLTVKYRGIREHIGTNEQKDPGKLNLNNITNCVPAGMPGMLSHPILFEFLFTPGRVTMLFDDTEVRKIYTDGRPHPPARDLDESFSGHSIGHWQGASLLVDTIGISPRADLFMSNGIHVTASTHVTERMSLNTQGLLQIDTTVTDPSVFEKPYAYTRLYQKVPGDFIPSCAENNRDTGSGTVDLTPP